MAFKSDNDRCVYMHIRLDTNKVFYIGIGTKSRSKDKVNRNKWWKNIVNKTDYEIQILKNNISWEEACELEKILISWYGRKDNKTGILCNLTDGGEGNFGVVISDERKLAVSKFHTGRKASSETKKKMSLAQTGKRASKETKLKQSKAKCKKVICTATGIIWDSLKICEKNNNMKRGCLSKYLCGLRKNKTTFKYYTE